MFLVEFKGGLKMIQQSDLDLELMASYTEMCDALGWDDYERNCGKSYSEQEQDEVDSLIYG